MGGPASASGKRPGTQAPQGQGSAAHGVPLEGSRFSPQSNPTGLAAEGGEGQGPWQLGFVFGLENPCAGPGPGGSRGKEIPVKRELQAPR